MSGRLAYTSEAIADVGQKVLYADHNGKEHVGWLVAGELYIRVTKLLNGGEWVVTQDYATILAAEAPRFTLSYNPR